MLEIKIAEEEKKNMSEYGIRYILKTYLDNMDKKELLTLIDICNEVRNLKK